MIINQAMFKGREDYLEWRAHWRKQFKATAKVIRYYKNDMKNRTPTQQSHIQSLLCREQMIARNLMIARAAVTLSDMERAAAVKNNKYSEYRVKRHQELGLPQRAGRSTGVSVGNRSD